MCATQYAYLIRQNPNSLKPGNFIYVFGPQTPAPACQRISSSKWPQYIQRISSTVIQCVPYPLNGIEVTTYANPAYGALTWRGDDGPPHWDWIQSYVDANHRADMEDCAQGK